MTKSGDNAEYSYWIPASLFFLSAALIAFQLLLMRMMAVISYHHFAYLVISTALLGFGTSGTLLTFYYDILRKNTVRSIFYLYLLLLISVPVCYTSAVHIPIDVRYLFYSAGQILLLVIYILLLFIPFLLGAVIIGFTLTCYKENISVLYGANLAGSGIGGLAGIGLMFIFPASQLPNTVTIFLVSGLICWLMANQTYFQQRRLQSSITVLFSFSLVVLCLTIQPTVKIDEYKALAHFRQLSSQQDAELVATRYGPRAQIDVYSSPTIHHTLFAGITADTVPPEQLAVLMDGHLAGTVFRADSIGDTRILDFTPQSIAYRLSDQPRVLLLGEVGGVNIWLAKRFNAADITVVQTNPQLLSLLKGPLAGVSDSLLYSREIEVIVQDPRLFLEQSTEKFDIIHFVNAETMPSAGNGLQGMLEDHLFTKEAVRTAINRLTENGFITMTRGMQTPARDNIKIFALITEGAKGAGFSQPSRHLLQSKNYLAVNTIFSKKIPTRVLLERYKKMLAELGMNIIFSPDFEYRQTQAKNLEINADQDTSYYHMAAQRIASGDGEAFYKKWIYNVRPPADNQPYFHNFFKWSSLPRFIDTYGTWWFRRVELGYAILVITFLILSLAGFAFIVLPLFFRQSNILKIGFTLPTLIYFGSIGLAFMFLEIVFIQYFSRFLGDPIYSVSAALTAILVCSGAGSAAQQFLSAKPLQRICLASLVILFFVLLYLWKLDTLLDTFIGFHTAGRFAITFLCLSPAAFFMGWMFPNGLQLLKPLPNRMTAWAWGVNGFLSVAASPLAVMLSMSFGFRFVMIMGLVFYITATIASRFLAPVSYKNINRE